MNRKALIVVATLALLIGGAVWIWSQSTQPSIVQEGPNPVKAPTNLSIGETSEIESVRDLIDGEYAFTPVDTSDWQTYRNEEAGFEVKIPGDWKLVNTYRDDSIRGSYLYFGGEGTTYSIPEGGEATAAILVSSSDRNNRKAMPLRDFLQKRKSGYDEKVTSLSIDETEAIMLGEKSVYLFNKDRAWTISLQLYYDRDHDIHQREHDTFLGIVKTFKFLK